MLDSEIKKNKETKMIGEDKNDINVLINYSQLLSFISDSLICQKCKCTVDVDCFRRTSYSFISNLYYKCKNKNCNYQHNMVSETISKCDDINNFIDDESFCKNDDNEIKNNNKNHRNSLGSYAINVNIICWIQQFGLSGTAVR